METGGKESRNYVIIELNPNPLILGSLLRGLRYRKQAHRQTRAYANTHKGKTNHE